MCHAIRSSKRPLTLPCTSAQRSLPSCFSASTTLASDPTPL